MPIELQQIRLSKIEQVCGSGKECLRSEDGYHMTLRPDLAAVVVTRADADLSAKVRSPGGGKLVQTIIPWAMVTSAVPSSPILSYKVETPWVKTGEVAAAGEAMEAKETEEAGEKTDKRREVLAKNRKKRWKGK